MQIPSPRPEGRPALPEVPEPDGLLTRPAGPWVRDKLEIIQGYAQGFSRACSRKARRWFYAEGFASSGVNRIRDTGELLWGSPLLVLRTDPPFSRALFVERSAPAAKALTARTAPFGDRAVVHQGDCNEVLVPLLHEHVDRWAPCLCVLDPEGFDLPWTTVEKIAAFRTGPRKVELLILFPDPGILREQGLTGALTLFADRDLTALFGHDRWKAIRERWMSDAITGAQARVNYVELYQQGLRDLGYIHVTNRPVLARSYEGRPLYTLVFATTHEAGLRIMSHRFKNVVAKPLQSSLFGEEPPPPPPWSA